MCSASEFIGNFAANLPLLSFAFGAVTSVMIFLLQPQENNIKHTSDSRFIFFIKRVPLKFLSFCKKVY
jgi:hypothetical protein